MIGFQSIYVLNVRRARKTAGRRFSFAREKGLVEVIRGHARLRLDRGGELERLQAVPWAVYCVDCQDLVDRLRARMDALRRPAA